jgi:hypothetical protein
VHVRVYVERIARMSAERGGDAGNMTQSGVGSYDIPWLAAGGAIAPTGTALAGEADDCYAPVRPPNTT